ncbi:MAG: hypothetical protein KC636_01155 [Myxococcales bacterium]|nr:hypothetical protein [Myxococcales bacterium]
MLVALIAAGCDPKKLGDYETESGAPQTTGPEGTTSESATDATTEDATDTTGATTADTYATTVDATDTTGETTADTYATTVDTYATTVDTDETSGGPSTTIGTTNGTTNGTTDSSTDGDDCVVPSGELELVLYEDDLCLDHTSEVIEGTFTLTQGGFKVSNANDEKIVTPVQPAIPEGTFVRLRYGCQTGFIPTSDWILIENLDTLNDAPNPTEAGGRLWYFMVAGGDSWMYPEPFELTNETVCMTAPFGRYHDSPQQVRATGPGFEIVALPESTESFVATAGPYAGAYELENFNVTAHTSGGGDSWDSINMRITRAD